MSCRKSAEAMTVLHAVEVMRAHTKAEDGDDESGFELETCEYGHPECASTLCPCCTDHALTVKAEGLTR